MITSKHGKVTVPQDDNGAVIERLERENRELRALLDKPLRSVRAEAVDSFVDYLETQYINNTVAEEMAIFLGRRHAQQLRNGEDNE